MNYPTSPRKESSSVSKLTVEYLKKFGQNRDLQQYFVLSTPFTTSDENLNVNTQQMETKIPASILSGLKKGPLWSDLNLPSSSTNRAYDDQRTLENENIDTGRLSSASSVISDKRLEWDSGADVGYLNYYNNKHKEKSLSLPALSTIESSGENSLSSISRRKTKKQTTFAESTPSSTTHKFFHQDEIEITAIPKENIEENVTTPQNIGNNLQKDKSISLEDTRLKPESSPKKSLSQIDLPNIEKSAVIENMYIFSPMFIKSLNDSREGNLSKTSDKIIQTTLEKVKSSPNTSCDAELFETARNNESSLTKVNSGIQIPTTSSFRNSSASLEKKDLISTSSSKSGNDYELPPDSNSNEVNDSTLDELIPEKKGLDTSYNITTTTSRSSKSDGSNKDSSGGHSIGSILMGSQYSTNLTKDLEHTVSAMRNIIEAKQYSEVDKKRLIRKIVKKIVNTHYDDDQPEHQFDESLNKNTSWSPLPSPPENLKSTPTSTNHSDSNVSPEVISSPTLHLTSFERYCSNVSPEAINSPTVLTSCDNVSSEVISSPTIVTSFEVLKETETNQKNIIDDEIPQLIAETSSTAETSWKRDITFSEQLFADRIKSLQNQRRHRDSNQKKKRNIFTNVEQLHTKIVKDVVETETGGDTMFNNLDNQKLLKITEQERETQLNWIKSEIYYLNRLRLLLEDNISPPITQVYTLLSNSSSSPSSNSITSSSVSKSNNNEKGGTPHHGNEIDKIIQKNYILTESSLSDSKKSVKSSHKTDRDLQNKIIANIQDAKAKEIWKLDLCENSTIKKRSKLRSQIRKVSKPNSTCYTELDCNLFKERNRKSIDDSIDKTSSDSGNNLALNPAAAAIHTDKYYKKIQKNENLDYYMPTDNEFSRKIIGLSRGSEKSKSDEKIQKSNDKVSKKKQRNEKFQHCRNSTTQTSDQKINSSSSSQEYVCKCRNKSAKVDKVTQTYENGIENESKNEKCSKTAKYPNENNDNKTSTSNTSVQTKNQHTSPLPISSTDSSRNKQSTVSKCTCKCRSIKSKNTSNNQEKVPSFYLDLKTSVDTPRTEQNSSSSYSKISSPVSPESIHDSGTNSIEFINHKFNKPPPIPQKSDNSSKSSPKSHYPKPIPNQTRRDVNSIPYKTWPINLESYKVIDKFLPNSDRIQQHDESKSSLNQNHLVSTKKKHSSKDLEYMQNNARQEYLHPPSNDCSYYKQKITPPDNVQVQNYLTMPKKCSHKKSPSEEEQNSSPSLLDVRNVSSYSTNNYNDQLPESISRRFPNSRMYRARESESEDQINQTSSKESIILKNFGDSASIISHHSFINANSNHSSHYSRTSSEIIIQENSPPISTTHQHSRNSTVHCLYHNPNFEHNLHKRIQQMLSRCETCSRQRIQKGGNQPQLEHCSECFCQCLDSNRQQIPDKKCSCKPNMPLCNTCKLNQESHHRHHNSIAYFLRIESRDDLLVEDSQTSSLQRRHTAIEEVKIYVPKFVKRGSTIIPNNSVKYVEEIGFNCQNSVQSLNEYLSKNKPEFIHAANSRQQCLKEISKKRDTNITKKVDRNNMETKYKITPKKTKLFSSRKMKEITYRKYRTLPEVEQKKYNIKLFRQRRANRLMVELFNKKLQQKVHKGELDLSLTKTLL